MELIRGKQKCSFMYVDSESSTIDFNSITWKLIFIGLFVLFYIISICKMLTNWMNNEKVARPFSKEEEHGSVHSHTTMWLEATGFKCFASSFLLITFSFHRETICSMVCTTYYNLLSNTVYRWLLTHWRLDRIIWVSCFFYFRKYNIHIEIDLYNFINYA